MNIEIRTTTETWILRLDDPPEEPGAAAMDVRRRINEGPVEVRTPDGQGPFHVAINPGHVVSIVEPPARPRGVGLGGLG